MKRILLASCLILQCYLVGFAQEEMSLDTLYSLSLEELMNMNIVTASKVAEKASDAPGIISTISAREIEQFGGLSLAEILERVTGVVNVSTNSNPQNIVSFRGDLSGESNNHTLLLINGRPNRESIYGGIDYAVLLGIPVTAIERIEVIRGPGSVLYGSNAFSGVVNIILKKGGDQNKVSTYLGSFGGASVDGSVNIDKGGVNVMIGYKNFEEKGWSFKATDAMGAKDTANYEEKNNGLAVRVGYKGLTINSLITESTQTIFGFGSPIWFNMPNKTTFSRRVSTDIGYELKFSEKVTTKVNATLNSFDLKLIGPAVASGNSDDIILEVSNFIRPTDKWNIVFGASGYKQTGELVGSVPKYNKGWYNGYVQADYRPVAPLKLIGGFQVNKIQGVDVNLVPRVGAIYNFTKNLGTKVLYGQAFRAAYAIETNIKSAVIEGNPNLNPEILKNLDVQVFYSRTKLELAATYFDNRKEDNITRLNGKFVNAGRNEAHGFELEGKYVPNASVYANGSYAYQTNKLVADNGAVTEHASLMPNHVAKLGVGFQNRRGLSLGLYNMYVSKFHSFTGQDALPGHNGETKSYNTLSANVNLSIPKIFALDMQEEIILSVYGTNLLDEKINIPDVASRMVYSLPGKSGRAIYASAIVKF
ncbi:TonB-dependent receptor plug domain-containing protein [Parachryseolinea silvisoli]|uniref:TonB-dependent receptor plug domain-containing protein n=1 Tax=Parachryseolinea silvisoli TaxID=2873601 RepID=UPI002265A5CF|nr:TonB-dependent receptor [Parachryseolinea silvisoli]MCD9015750.1 TonB-dependent receptor [Parachryseolinea silvisoli]